MEDERSRERAICLNCAEPLRGAFCAQCGQAADTGRLTVVGLARELGRRVLYLDSAMYRTLGALALRPGHVVRDYVRGHRVSHFNPFALLAVMALLDSTLRGYWDFSLAADASDAASRQLLALVEDARLHQAKWFILAGLPLRAGVSYAWFRRAEQSFAEHLVIECYAAAAALGIASVADGVTALAGAAAASPLSWVSLLATSAYQLTLYAQYFSAFGYGRAALVGRSLLAVLTLPLLVVVSLLVWLGHT